MLGTEQEYFFKDFFIIFSAIFGLIILVAVQLKNSGFRFRPLGRRQSDLSRFEKFNLQKHKLRFDINWSYSAFGFGIRLEEQHAIWQISVFTMKKINEKMPMHKIHGNFWYNFAKSKKETEKIMSPILRKLFNKYKDKLDSDKSIQLVNKDLRDYQLYSWLKNETHVHTAIYSFLDECIYIAGQFNLRPFLTIYLSNQVYLEISIPKNELLESIEKEFKNLYAVEFSVDNYYVKIKFWLAFCAENIPQICIKNYNQSNILNTERIAS
jgi:hypothetical protein